jgi:ABC-type phosphate/phosphonate transport system substrate-binding protein
MAGYTILSGAGYAPDFVRHDALEAWTLPQDVKIEATGQILSALRRAAGGEPVAVLLDQTQTAALSSLPFANELKVLVQSPALPVALIAMVASRVTAARARTLQTALIKMGEADAGSLQPLRLHGFVMPKLPSRTPAP